MKLRIIIGLAVVVILFFIKYFFFPSQSIKDGKKEAQNGTPPKTNVSAFVIQTEPLDNITYASGTILANEEVQLQAELSGKIVRLNFQEGSKVSKGKLLVKLNDADLQANYKKLELQLGLASDKMTREEKLLAIGGISQEGFDNIKNQYDIIKTDLDFAKAQIAKTEIRAPFDGIVGLRNISEGAYVTSSTTIASVQQTNPVKIDFYIPERYARKIESGDKILFTIEGNKQEISGEVYAIEPKINLETRTVQIRAICPNADGKIFAGAFAKVQLNLGIIEDAIMIPTEAVIPDLKGKKVIKLNNGITEFVTVVTELRTNSKVQIIEGLAKGDTIITRGIMQLKPGSFVNITDLK
jgi:membrane fusion protein, multidrug efflux system